MIQALTITEDQDILAIHKVVSQKLQKQIEQCYPHLFKPVQLDFEEWGIRTEIDKLGLPFFVGRGLCEYKEDINKCLLVYSNYTVHLDEQPNGYSIIRFFRKQGIDVV